MQRRTFVQALLGLVASPAVVNAHTTVPRHSILLQTSPIAGFQYHQGENVWPLLKTNAPLKLKRETDNRFDKHAIAVYWKNDKLGYVPRRENITLAQMLDRDQTLHVRIKSLNSEASPWGRIDIKIELVWSGVV